MRQIALSLSSPGQHTLQRHLAGCPFGEQDVTSQEGVEWPGGREVAKREQVLRRASDSEGDVEFPEGTSWPRGYRVAVGRRAASTVLSGQGGIEQSGGR